MQRRTSQIGRGFVQQALWGRILRLTEFVVADATVSRRQLLPLASESVCQTAFAQKSEHSRKPDADQGRLEAMHPAARKLELFARRRRQSWDAGGNKVA